jgi:hypothetical protein
MPDDWDAPPTGYAYIECRGKAHTWDLARDPADYEYPWGEVPERDRYVAVCTVCGGVLFRAIDLYGNDVYTPIYEHPDGYRMERDTNPPKAAWRRELVDQMYTQRMEQRMERRQQRRQREGEANG